MLVRKAILSLLCAFGLQACGNDDQGPLHIAMIGSAEEVFAEGARLEETAQHMRGAVHTGLVSRDAQGNIVTGLADRWIVTDGGRSYIFRLRDGNWSDGSELTAESARAALQRAIRDLRGTSMGLDLAPITEVRAMAGRVVELRLSGPFPSLLQLLAQPELALQHGNGAGPMALVQAETSARLDFLSPQERGLPQDEDWADYVRPLEIRAVAAQEAVRLFDDGEVNVVLGGRIGSFPLPDTGPLSRGTVRIDPATGIFGLQVMRANGALSSPELREAMTMAIDRPALMSPFNIGGWAPTTRVVAPGLPDDPGLIAERWSDQSLTDLRARAASRIAQWRSAQQSNAGADGGGVDADRAIVLRIAIGTEPGHDMLLRELSQQFAQIGITLERAENGQTPDLLLVDRLARYAAPRWFLNQFHCSLRRGLCDQEADDLVYKSLLESDPDARARLLAEAEAKMTLANVYIPFGSPLRWSLVRGNVQGYAANRWAFHPLPLMAERSR